jgi:hypothetical protein
MALPCTIPSWLRWARASLLILVLILAPGLANAADPKEVDAAIRRGSDFLKQQYGNGAAPQDATYGIGPAALAGLALLETGTPANHQAVANIAKAVRYAVPAETKTYQIVLCLLFLHRLGDPGDEARIQLLAVRLLAGQNARGGWTYECVDSVPRDVEQRLRARLGENTLVSDRGGTAPAATQSSPAKDRGNGPPPAARLHAEVQKYAATLSNSRVKEFGDDNSNTQFAILGTWVARGHGIAVESALDMIEKRFLSTQDHQTGGWPYNGHNGWGSPSMTCAGLIGLATAIGRREERLLKAAQNKPAPAPAPTSPAPTPTTPETKSNDPFFSPPPREEVPPPKKKEEAQPPKKGAALRAQDARDQAVRRGMENLGQALAGNQLRDGRIGGGRRGEGRGPGGLNLYFLWSLERVGVIFGVDKIGGIDWYATGADSLLPAQQQDGSWGGGEYGPEVNTSFALLFLSRSNVVRSLSSKVQRTTAPAELRANAAPSPEPSAPTETKVTPTAPKLTPASPSASATTPLPTPMPRATSATPAGDAAGKLAGELVRAAPAERDRVLRMLRDEKGADYTRALVLAIPLLEGDNKKAARQALADRLTRMTPDTLRELMKSPEAECRRGAVLAAAMKDDRNHVPDLITRLTDDDDSVRRAARAGLKSFASGKDFGPEPGASKADQDLAIRAWRAWWDSVK